MDSLADYFDAYCRATILIAASKFAEAPRDAVWFDRQLENEIEQGLITKDKAAAIKAEINKQLNDSFKIETET